MVSGKATLQSKQNLQQCVNQKSRAIKKIRQKFIRIDFFFFYGMRISTDRPTSIPPALPPL